MLNEFIFPTDGTMDSVLDQRQYYRPPEFSSFSKFTDFKFEDSISSLDFV